MIFTVGYSNGKPPQAQAVACRAAAKSKRDRCVRHRVRKLRYNRKRGLTALMIPVAKDISKLLVGIPKGAWVALSSDQEHVVAYAGELQDAIQKSKAVGGMSPLCFVFPRVNIP